LLLGCRRTRRKRRRRAMWKHGRLAVIVRLILCSMLRAFWRSFNARCLGSAREQPGLGESRSCCSHSINGVSLKPLQRLRETRTNIVPSQARLRAVRVVGYLLCTAPHCGIFTSFATPLMSFVKISSELFLSSLVYG
jgi:hypothetical protein